MLLFSDDEEEGEMMQYEISDEDEIDIDKYQSVRHEKSTNDDLL